MTEYIDSSELHISADVHTDGAASVTIGARFEKAPAVIIADGQNARQALADLLRATADKLDPSGQNPAACRNPWHGSAPARAQLTCSECP
jgi:hypothetical protein